MEHRAQAAARAQAADLMVEPPSHGCLPGFTHHRVVQKGGMFI
jgi:hypothetical protein